MPTNAELNRMVQELTGEHMALRAAFESHREHCATDKRTMNDRLDAINNKLWAGLVLLALNLLGMTAYLAVEGPPWSKTVAAEVARR